MHLGRSNSQSLRPPLMICCIANRVQIATLQQSRELFGGGLLHRWQVSSKLTIY